MPPSPKRCPHSSAQPLEVLSLMKVGGSPSPSTHMATAPKRQQEIEGAQLAHRLQTWDADLASVSFN